MLVSVVTINYNNKQGLQKTIASVISQSFKDFEFIIIDGGSTDGSKEVIIENKDNVGFWVSEVDSGIYNAMNKGIEKAKGKYLFFLNSGDDFVDIYSLENMSKYLKNEKLVYFDINVIKADGTSYVKKCPERLTAKYFYDDTLPHQSVFIHKELFTDIGGYDENLKIVSDWKFILVALVKHNITYKHVSKVFSNFYRDGISSNSSNQILVKQEREAVLAIEFPLLLETIKDNYKLQRILRNLRKSKKIKLLIRLGLIDKF